MEHDFAWFLADTQLRARSSIGVFDVFGLSRRRRERVDNKGFITYAYLTSKRDYKDLVIIK